MSVKSYHVNKEPLVKYIMEHSFRLTEAQKELNDETLKHARFYMLGAPEVLQLTSNLIKTIKAKKILDVGVYTGASALSGALALPDDGEVYALDISEEYMNIGKPYWKKSNISHKIKTFIGPALNFLNKFIDEGLSETFDFAFIDADKQNYINYYEACLKLLRSGGIIAVDNTIWSGKVVDESDNSEITTSIRAFNEHVKDDVRIDISLLNIGDGLTLCFKK